jgi:formylglycine-generating enzyme required for sulfatase activity
MFRLKTIVYRLLPLAALCLAVGCSTTGRQTVGNDITPAETPAPIPDPVASSVPENMVRVEGGAFIMGSPESKEYVWHGREYDEVQHHVTVSDFYMGRYEVTQAEYEAVMEINPSSFKGAGLPVERVSWYDAIEYCNRRSEKEELTPAYRITKDRADTNNTSRDRLKWVVTWNEYADGYRLPTETEWEYAAKGGNRGAVTYTYAGSNDVDAVSWNLDEKTHEVGTKAPNSLGIYDMSGNVEEWCWDWYGEYRTEAQTDPTGATFGESRVTRGGSWSGNLIILLRSANRGGHMPEAQYSDLGFRVVRSTVEIARVLQDE